MQPILRLIEDRLRMGFEGFVICHVDSKRGKKSRTLFEVRELMVDANCSCQH